MRKPGLLMDNIARTASQPSLVRFVLAWLMSLRRIRLCFADWLRRRRRRAAAAALMRRSEQFAQKSRLPFGREGLCRVKVADEVGDGVLLLHIRCVAMAAPSYEEAPGEREPPVRLVSESGSSLFLDVDGTLLDIASAPELVVMPPELSGTLSRLSDLLGGALALVSGRPIAQLDRLFAPLKLPAAGEHGAEIRLAADQAIVAAPPPSALAQLVAQLTATTTAIPGVRIERKRAGVAVHYRQAPEQAPLLRGLIEAAVAGHVADVQVMPGKMVLEIKERAYSKGEAVVALMQRAPFAGRSPLFLGDDASDRDGFAAARRFGGCGVAVGFDHADAADWLFASPAAARAWLVRVVAALQLRP
jgi:trehalose 6-phosphate phosphatase